MAIPIPVKPGTTRFRGIIRELNVRQGNFGQVILVSFEEPGQSSYRVLSFPLSDRPNSKWMAFINSLNRALPKPIEDASELLDLDVEVEIRSRALQTPDGTREVEYPEVVAVYPIRAIEPELRELFAAILGEVGGDKEAFKAKAAELGYTDAQAEAAYREVARGSDDPF